MRQSTVYFGYTADNDSALANLTKNPWNFITIMCRLHTSHTQTYVYWKRNRIHTDPMWSFLICNSWNSPYAIRQCWHAPNSTVKCSITYTQHGMNGASLKILQLPVTGIHQLIRFRVIKFMRSNAFHKHCFSMWFSFGIFCTLTRSKCSANVYHLEMCAAHTRAYVQKRRERICGKIFALIESNVYSIWWFSICLEKEWMNMYHLEGIAAQVWWLGMTWLTRWCKFLNAIIFG